MALDGRPSGDVVNAVYVAVAHARQNACLHQIRLLHQLDRGLAAPYRSACPRRSRCTHQAAAIRHSSVTPSLPALLYTAPCTPAAFTHGTYVAHSPTQGQTQGDPVLCAPCRPRLSMPTVIPVRPDGARRIDYSAPWRWTLGIGQCPSITCMLRPAQSPSRRMRACPTPRSSFGGMACMQGRTAWTCFHRAACMQEHSALMEASHASLLSGSDSSAAVG